VGKAWDFSKPCLKIVLSLETDLRLGRIFRLSNDFWLRAQVAYDTEIAEPTLGPLVNKINVWSDDIAQQEGFVALGNADVDFSPF
jgi:hypothetical protein